MHMHVCMYVCTWFPQWWSGEESTRKCRRWRRHGFDPWVRKISWGRKWQPTPIFLHEQRNLVSYSPWGHKELKRTEHTPIHTYIYMYVCMYGGIAHRNLNATCAQIYFWSATSQKKANHLFQGFITSQNVSWKRHCFFPKLIMSKVKPGSWVCLQKMGGWKSK